MYGNGLFKKSELIGKQLSEIENKKFVEFHKSQEGTQEGLYSHRKLTHFNSNFLEFLDQWDMYRGWYNIIFLLLLSVCAFGIFVGLLISLKDLSFIIIFALSILFLISSHLIYILFKVYNNYIYFPIRFNRVTQEVYVLDPNKKQYSFKWDDLRVGLFTRADGYMAITFLDVDSDGIINYAFSLPFATGVQPHVPYIIGHWDFVKRYMEGNVEECFNSITEYYPAFERKETFKETLWHSAFLYDDDIIIQRKIDSLNVYAIAIAFFGADTIGRFLSKWINKVPKFSEDINAKCLIDLNDPYNIKNHLAPHKPLNLTFGQKLGVGIRLSIGLSFLILAIEILGATRGQSPFGIIAYVFY